MHNINLRRDFVCEQNKPKHPALIVVGIMCFYVVMADFTLLTPAIQTMYEHFSSTTTYAQVMAMVSVTGIISFPASLVFGVLFEKVGYKIFGTLGILLVAVGGLFPYFMPDTTDITVLVASRIIVGLGLGSVNSIGAALINRLFTGVSRVTLLGIGNTLFYGSASLFALLSGWLTTIGWNYVFLSYGITLIPLVIVILVLAEPEKIQTVKSEQHHEAKGARIPVCAYGYCALMLVYAMVNFAIIQLNSAMVAEFEIGSPVIAGIATSIYTLGGAVAGFCFAFTHRVFDKWNLPVMFGLSAVFAFALYGLHSLPAILFCSFCAGWCNIIILSHLQERLGASVPRTRIALMNAGLLGMMNVGTFLGAYYVDIASNLLPEMGLLGTRFTTGIVYIAITVITALIAAKSPRLKDRHYKNV